MVEFSLSPQTPVSSPSDPSGSSVNEQKVGTEPSSCFLLGAGSDELCVYCQMCF